MAKAKKKQDEVVEAEVETTEAPVDTEDMVTNEDATSEDTGVKEDIDEDLGADEATEDDNAEGEEPHTTKAGRHSAKAVREAETEAARKAAVAEKKDEPAEAKPRVVQRPNPLKQHGKAYRAAAELVDATKRYEIEEALILAKQTAKTKFDASVELHVNLGVDPRQADQMVRATVVLPAGTGKSLRVAVLAPADKHAEAKKAGAEIVSDGDLIAKIEKGQLDFDVLVATPDMMAKLGKVAKVLGPRGLMPNPKSGTVTASVGAAVEQAKAGRVEFRIDKQAIVHVMIGKASFSEDKLASNVKALIDAILKAKPAAAKGTYVNAITLSTSMGPGIKLDIQKAIAAANPKR